MAFFLEVTAWAIDAYQSNKNLNQEIVINGIPYRVGDVLNLSNKASHAFVARCNQVDLKTVGVGDHAILFNWAQKVDVERLKKLFGDDAFTDALLSE